MHEKSLTVCTGGHYQFIKEFMLPSQGYVQCGHYIHPTVCACENRIHTYTMNLLVTTILNSSSSK